jgi:hypothetical protein
MNAALSEVHHDGRRYAIDKSGKKWYWGAKWSELYHIDKATGERSNHSKQSCCMRRLLQ